MSLFKRKRTPNVPKLIIEADEPALFYSSISRAESDLEAIDVENGVYKAAFGPHGEHYRIETADNLVIISLDSSRRPDPTRLKAVILNFLDAVHISAPRTEGLDSLISRCAPFTE